MIRSRMSLAGGVSVLPATPAALTAQGTLLGTFRYMAPEQIEGAEADARSDIFAFGVVLYEVIAGRNPFAGGTAASGMASILTEEPPRLEMKGRALEHLVTYRI
jgi:serine/threonine protein kinase